MFENLKKVGKLILVENVKQTASANNIFISGFIKQTARENNIYTGGLLNTTASENNIFTSDFLKQPAIANVISTCGLLKKTANENLVSTHGFLKQPASVNVISTSGCKTTASEKADFYWPLVLVALKNISANSSRTASIELLCTSEIVFNTKELQPDRISNVGSVPISHIL